MKEASLKKIILTVIILTQTPFLVNAQNSKEEKYYINNNKHWLVEIPIWIPGFRGQIAYGDFDLSSSGDREEREFKRLNSDVGIEFYLVGRISAQYNKLWIQTDIFSGEVGSAFSYNSLIGNNEKEIVIIKIKGTFTRLITGYSVWQKSTENGFKIGLTPYIGLRYVSFHLKSDIFGLTKIIDVNPNWLEPLIGLNIPISYKRFKVEIQADYGATETKNSWVVSNRYRYRISKLVDVQLGWNLIRLYHKGLVGNDELESTIRLFGPTAGVGFRF